MARRLGLESEGAAEVVDILKRLYLPMSDGMRRMEKVDAQPGGGTGHGEEGKDGAGAEGRCVNRKGRGEEVTHAGQRRMSKWGNSRSVQLLSKFRRFSFEPLYRHNGQDSSASRLCGAASRGH